MCGVIGVHLSNPTDADLFMVRNIFIQSMIRGKHATGVTYFDGEKLITKKEPIPAKKFMEKHHPEDWVYDHDFVDGRKELCFIGHIRYSTSDLRYNQPFQSDKLAIAHNGVISQEPVETWEFPTETANDSELILRCFENEIHPLVKYVDRSMAVTCIQILNREEVNKPFPFLSGFRNHERPLYRAKRENGVIFASTKDILNRSGIYDNVERTDPFVEYYTDGYSKRWHPSYLGKTEPRDLQP